MLDSVVSGLWALIGEPGGKYARLVGGFEQWVGKVEGMVVMRKRNAAAAHGKGEDGGGELFIPQLSQAWRDEAAAMVRRLDDWRRKLRVLGDVPELPASSSSSTPSTTTTTTTTAAAAETETPTPPPLARVLDACRTLVHGMLAELDEMERVERAAAADEMRWVREMNRRMAAESVSLTDSLSGSRRAGTGERKAGAIWRGF
ncbi:hypothetical protein VTJ49DRAFT_5695 [Mycothermus thermophilus]|uniref:Uncharacterized protein n=1 Tax=Humicola insolens TaxID=85995 RepID=A0ABR3V2J3_HUMIN